MTSRRLWFAAITLSVMAAAFAAANWLGYRATLKQISERGEAGLTLAAQRLTLELDQYRYLPALLAKNERVMNVLTAPDAIGAGNLFLQRVADTTGALDIYVMDERGRTLAASNWNLERSFIDQNYAWRPYFQRAVTGGLGYYHAVGSQSGQRGFYFSHPVIGPSDDIVGVIAVKLDLERIESQWRADPEPLFFSDSDGVIFMANRPALVFRQWRGGALTEPERYQGVEITLLRDLSTSTRQGFEIWRSNLNDLPEEALFLSRVVPTIDMTAHILMDTSNARTQALLWGGLAATIAGIFALMAAILIQRRYALASRLAIEERARNQLEEKVTERTAALARVQGELVQAGKLTALGEMSAGLSHELNQPLAAIQTLADNADILLDRGDTDRTRDNLGKISQVAQRMARIIKNFRDFSRKEGDEKTGDVDLVAIIEDALSLAEGKLKGADVIVNWSRSSQPIIVRGGRVRLQQVVVNLISNAADAMQNSPEKRLDIDVTQHTHSVNLLVRDTGPGLQTPEKIFDPFYTTKTVGEGLGLGLSISYGIVQSFGGKIIGENHQEGGAIFTVELVRPESVAA